ncbi:MAG: glycosyltransferase family 2 protein [Candidatus Pacebacteria bacterium]|nr:glycosyltransferase family 2 protein [Candidatus Paceibacterota bacterium]MDR3582767.1 glycosyltransferase family 2 protein [Candidatus Paceibacterota bacterium]
MKLSFVIPAWNEEKYIARTLDSVIRQVKKSGRDIEIIVVNNASRDRTGEIARQYPDVIVVDEPRKGLPQARQAGFLAASGDLIANMDADSILPEGWIEKTYEHFSNDPKLASLSGPYQYYEYSAPQNFIVSLYYVPAFMAHSIGRRLFGKGGIIQGGNFVLKRSALERVGGFNTDIKFYGEDTDIARRIQAAGKVKFDFSFKMTTSARRLQKDGFWKTAWRYSINHFWILLFKKPFTQSYTCVGNDDVK